MKSITFKQGIGIFLITQIIPLCFGGLFWENKDFKHFISGVIGGELLVIFFISIFLFMSLIDWLLNSK